MVVLGLGVALVATLSELGGFRFRLFSPEGDDFGEYETVVPNWCAGDEFSAADGRVFRLLEILPRRKEWVATRLSGLSSHSIERSSRSKDDRGDRAKFRCGACSEGESDGEGA